MIWTFPNYKRQDWFVNKNIFMWSCLVIWPLRSSRKKEEGVLEMRVNCGAVCGGNICFDAVTALKVPSPPAAAPSAYKKGSVGESGVSVCTRHNWAQHETFRGEWDAAECFFSYTLFGLRRQPGFHTTAELSANFYIFLRRFNLF